MNLDTMQSVARRTCITKIGALNAVKWVSSLVFLSDKKKNKQPNVVVEENDAKKSQNGSLCADHVGFIIESEEEETGGSNFEDSRSEETKRRITGPCHQPSKGVSMDGSSRKILRRITRWMWRIWLNGTQRSHHKELKETVILDPWNRKKWTRSPRKRRRRRLRQVLGSILQNSNFYQSWQTHFAG